MLSYEVIQHRAFRTMTPYYLALVIFPAFTKRVFAFAYIDNFLGFLLSDAVNVAVQDHAAVSFFGVGMYAFWPISSVIRACMQDAHGPSCSLCPH